MIWLVSIFLLALLAALWTAAPWAAAPQAAALVSRPGTMPAAARARVEGIEPAGLARFGWQDAVETPLGKEGVRKPRSWRLGFGLAFSARLCEAWPADAARPGMNPRGQAALHRRHMISRAPERRAARRFACRSSGPSAAGLIPAI